MAHYGTHKSTREGRTQTLARKAAREAKRIGAHTDAIRTIRKGA